MDETDMLVKTATEIAVKKKTTDTLPFSEAECRAMMLKVAGFDPERLGEATRKGFEKLIELLDAKATKFATHEGKITDSALVADNNTQRKAAETLVNLGFEVYPKPTDTSAPADHTTIIDLSGWVPKKEEE